MADTLTTQSGTLATVPASSVIATDDAGAGGHVQIVKLAISTDGSATALTADNTDGLLVNLGGNNDVTVTSGTITTITNVVSVDDNAGSLTIDNTNLDNLHSADFDTGAGADTTPAIGIAVPASGGAAVIPGDATAGLKVDLGADNDVTVTGSVTANAGTNLNTSALALETGGNLATLAGAVAGTEMQVDIVADGAGLATAANQSTMITALQLIDNPVLVDDAAFTPATSSVMMAGFEFDDVTPDVVDEGDAGAARMSSRREIYTQIRDAAGNERGANVDASGNLQVDIAADSVGIGGGTQYTEDDAAAANPVGTQPVLVRQDTPATLVSLDGDVVAQRATNYGAAFVQVLDSSGNFINTFGGSGGTATADDGAFTAGVGQGTPVMGFATSDVVDAGDVGVLAMDTSRNLKVSIEVDNVGIGGGTQYAVDAALGATPTGTLAVAIRDDALSALTPVEGDAIGLRVDGTGALWVTTDDTLNVTESNSAAILADTASMDTNLGTVAGAVAGTEMQVDIVSDGAGLATTANQSTMITALQLIDDIVYTDDTSTHATGSSKGALVMAAATPTDSAVEANDIGAVAMSLDRRLHVDADITAQTLANLQVQSNSANLATEATVAAIQTAVEIIDDWDNAASDGASVSGDVAHDTADAGEPVKVGHKAIAHGTSPTAVAANDRTNWYANRHGVPWVMGGHPNLVTLRANYTTAQTDAAIITITTGQKIVVTRCSVTADNACSVDVAARVGFGTVNTPTTTGVVLSHPGIAAGSGVVEGSGAGMLGVGADNEDLRITSEVPTGGSIDVVVSYYIIES